MESDHNNNHEDSNSNNSEAEEVLGELGEFDRDKAEQARSEVIEQQSDNAETPDDSQKESEPEEIDDSVFDQLMSESFASLPESEKKQIRERCKKAYDQALEQFASQGSFSDPETDRYSGGKPHLGMDGAKRGVDYIVYCAIRSEELKQQIAEKTAKLDELKKGFLAGILKKKQIKALEDKIASLRAEEMQCSEWVEHIGSSAFRDPKAVEELKEKTRGVSVFGFSDDYVAKLRAEGKKAMTQEEYDELERPIKEASSAVFHSKEKQDAFQRLIRMKKALRSQSRS